MLKVIRLISTGLSFKSIVDFRQLLTLPEAFTELVAA